MPGKLLSTSEKEMYFQMWFKGASMLEIAKANKRAVHTITALCKKEGWQERKQRIIAKANEESDITLAEWTKKGLAMMETAATQLYEKMQKGDVPVKSLEGAVTSLGHNMRTQGEFRGLASQPTVIVLNYENVKRPTQEEIQSATQVIPYLTTPTEKMN